nr:MAG TPA: hypothetical protein [Caudoviricetes sp.]
MYLSPEDVDKLVSKETEAIWNTGGLEFLTNGGKNVFES